jgi:hypothetical protein
MMIIMIEDEAATSTPCVIQQWIALVKPEFDHHIPEHNLTMKPEFDHSLH